MKSCNRQSGIVLFVTLVILVLVSLLAITSMRNTASAENVSGAVRTTELAMQAAEIALRHCEESVAEVIRVANGKPPSIVTTFTLDKIVPPESGPVWESVGNWDKVNTETFVLDKALLNSAYKRAPECMVGAVPIVRAGASVPTTTAAFIITARGFGPEVADADASRSRPVGTEIWLQSHITLE